MLQACIEELTRVWNASKELERKFQKFSTEVSMLFQGSNINMSKVIQSSLEGVSRKFCFLILLLHGTHRSYLSRRRACLKRWGGVWTLLSQDHGRM